MNPPARDELGALGVDPRQHDRLRAADALEHAGEELVLEAVVERDRRRRAHDDDRLARVEARARRAPPRRGLEVGEVVLLLEARVARELAGRAVAARGARAGSRRGRPRARASRQLIWCWTVAHS